MKKVTDNLNISNAKIGFRNFAGKEGQYNTAGNRNFAIFLDDIEDAKRLEADGWNVRWLRPKSEDEQEQPILSVKLSFDLYPPKIVLVSKTGLSQLGKDEIEILDWADIKCVDITIRPYNYDVGGKSGVKGYVKNMYVTLQEDEWEDKYMNRPDTAQDVVGGCGNCDICDGSCGNPATL